jgi:hypothetical protein
MCQAAHTTIQVCITWAVSQCMSDKIGRWACGSLRRSQKCGVRRVWGPEPEARLFAAAHLTRALRKRRKLYDRIHAPVTKFVTRSWVPVLFSGKPI